VGRARARSRQKRKNHNKGDRRCSATRDVIAVLVHFALPRDLAISILALWPGAAAVPELASGVPGVPRDADFSGAWAEAKVLFCTEQGREIRRDRMAVIVRHIGRWVGIRVYPHRLRHMFATWYIKEGGDPYSLQYLLGQEDMTVTRMYVKIADAEAKRTYRSLLDGL
jgi:hypothetical protein